MAILRRILKGLRYSLRLVRRPTTIAIAGNRISFPASAGPSLRRALYSERYESEEVDSFRKMVEPNDRVLELGAGIGHLTTVVAKALGSENVLAVEANPHLEEWIRRNFQQNHVEPRLVSALAGSIDGEQSILNIAGDFWASSVKSAEGQIDLVTVATADCNRLISETGANFLICDIEGAEVDLLPALDLAPIDKMIVEFHPHVVGWEAYRQLMWHLLGQGFAYNPYRSNGYSFSFARMPDSKA